MANKAGRPKKDKVGTSVSVYLSPERVEKALRLGGSLKEGLLKALDAYSSIAATAEALEPVAKAALERADAVKKARGIMQGKGAYDPQTCRECRIKGSWCGEKHS